MNLAGKILTVLIFVMSVVFSAFAVGVYMAHKNYKELLTNDKPQANKEVGLQTKLAEARKRVAALTTEAEKLRTAIDEQQKLRRQQLAKLEHELAEWKEHNAKDQEELAALIKTARDDTEEGMKTHKTLVQREEELADLRAKIAAVDKDRQEKLERAMLATEELHGKVNEKKALQDRNAILDKDYQHVQQIERY